MFRVERRLGCIGCPLVYKTKRIEELKRAPNLVKAMCKAADKWLKAERDKPLKSSEKFENGYELFYFSLLCDSYNKFLEKKNNLFDDFDAKKEIFNMFGIKEES